MFPHAQRFEKWLRRRSPHTATPTHYLNDLKLFFAWAGKPPEAITLHDVDAYLDHCRRLGHAVTTINQRLAALRTFYHFLQTETDAAPPNPVLPRRHVIRQGRRLPRDARDADLARLFAVITAPRDQAMFLLMLRCGLRVGEVRQLSLNNLCFQPPRLRVCGKGRTLCALPISLPRLWPLCRRGWPPAPSSKTGPSSSIVLAAA
jgi:site-specific recombinase XerD